MKKDANPQRLGKPQLWMLVIASALASGMEGHSQPAKGANKFLGNITSRGQVRTDFGTYWNQITPENETKWGSVEGTRDRMSWTGADRVANYAKTAGIAWKFHTLAWGGQAPGWISGLAESEQLQEVEEWFDEAQKKYPDVPMIDVVNEAHPNHAPAPFRNALGGNGTTGYDWIFKAFQMARQRWPNAILIYNDYNNIEYNNEVTWTVGLIEAAIKAKVPIDAIGCQTHDAYKINTATVKGNLDKLAATGLPLFITEYDIGYSDDTQQLNSIKDQFPVFWNHPSVVGVTYWGYVVGETWRTGTGLITSGGAERPSLTWLKGYVKDNPNPQNKFPNFLAKTGTSLAEKPRPSLRAGAKSKGQLRIFDIRGREIPSFFGGPGERTQAMNVLLPIPSME